MTVELVAHRARFPGFSDENTVAGANLCWRLGYPWVEVDVHATVDGAAVLRHDEVLPGGKRVNEALSDEVGDDRLRALLVAASGRGLFVDVKARPETAEAYATAVKLATEGLRLKASRLVWLSFCPEVLTALRELELPGRYVAIATSDSRFDGVCRLARTWAERPRAGRLAAAYGVNDGREARRLEDLGVRYLITDELLS